MSVVCNWELTPRCRARYLADKAGVSVIERQLKEEQERTRVAVTEAEVCVCVCVKEEE